MARSTVTKAQSSLAGVAILARLSPQALESVERRCAFRRYEPGRVDRRLSRPDRRGVLHHLGRGARHHLFACRQGGELSRARAWRGVRRVSRHRPRPALGKRGGAHACLVATLPGAAFRELIENEPVVALAMLPQLVTKIRALTTRVYEFSTLAVSNRIQAELLRLASLGAKEGKGARIAPAPTHTEIASPGQYASRGGHPRAHAARADRPHRAGEERAGGHRPRAPRRDGSRGHRRIADCNHRVTR